MMLRVGSSRTRRALRYATSFMVLVARQVSVTITGLISASTAWESTRIITAETAREVGRGLRPAASPCTIILRRGATGARHKCMLRLLLLQMLIAFMPFLVTLLTWMFLA